MNAEINKIITQYLSGELSAADRIVFEEKLKNNSELQQEVALQQSLIEAVKRSSTRTQVQNVSKSFHVKQTIKWTGISLVIATVLTALTILVYKQATNTSENDLSQFEVLIEKLKDEELINNLPSEFFAWNGADTAMLSNNGILISIPESAFFLNGDPYTDAALIQFQEALDATSIVKSGLSTESNGKLLETQGMFSFSAFTPDGEKLTINPKTGIYVQVPVDEYKSDMQLFTGVEGKDGIINWVNPKPLAKIPVPVDMTDLNFYPPGYEDSLNAMKLRKDKKYRDSLYLSCEESNFYASQGQSATSGEALFNSKCASCHQAHKDGTGPKLYNVRQKWAQEGAKQGSIYTWVNNWQKAIISDPYAKHTASWSPTAMQSFPEMKKSDIDAIFDYVDGQVKPKNSEQFEIISEKLIYPDRMKDWWQNHVIWDYKIEYLPNNEALIIAKATFAKESESQMWGFVEIPYDFVDRQGGYDLKYKKSKEIIFGFNESTDFYPIGNLNYKIKSNNVYTYDLKWSTDEDLICTQKIKLLNGQPFKIQLVNQFQIMTESPPCLIKQEVILNLNGANSSLSSAYEISPSNVLAFWKPSFNNTILSTREFEKRMQAIHGTCNNKVLEVYTKNLNKSLTELDKQVAEMGYPNFETFASENIGSLNPNNPHLKTLESFYQKNIEALRKEVKHNRDKEQKRRNKHDKNVQDERIKEANRSSQRNQQNYTEEYDFNYEYARKQLGQAKKSIQRQFSKTVGTTITATGIYNLDRFVAEVTTNRKTGEFFDKETGKTARIQYNDFSIEVANPENYDQLYVYLFPSELSSYQRIPGSNGKFTYSLNDAMIYDLAIVGISEKGYSYVQKSTFKEGKFGTVSLENVSEVKLNASIEQLNNNRLSKPINIKDELDWLIIEQKNYVEQRNRQDQFLFHERIKKIVFPCYEGTGMEVAGPDTDPEIVVDKPFGIK